MLDTQPTLGSVESTMAEKRKLAEQSLHWNVGNPKFRNLFPELVTKYRESNGLR